jgi:hypothetical protein
MQMINKLAIWDTITLGWSKVHGAKKSIWAAILVLMLIVFLLNFILGSVFGGISLILYNPTTLHFLKGMDILCGVIFALIQYLLMAGLIYIGIQRAYDLPISYRFMFYTFNWRMGFKIIGVLILKAIVCLPAFILMMLPALPVMMRAAMHPADVQNNAAAVVQAQSNLSALSGVFFATSYLVGLIILMILSLRLILSLAFILDKNVNPWQAIVLSFKATHGNAWRIFGFYILAYLILFLSAIPFGIGLIWTIPLIFICYGLVYKTLSLNIDINHR